MEFGGKRKNNPEKFEFEERNNAGITVIGLVNDVITAFRKAGWKHDKIIILFHYGERYDVVNEINRLWSSQLSRHHAVRVHCTHCRFEILLNCENTRQASGIVSKNGSVRGGRVCQTETLGEIGEKRR